MDYRYFNGIERDLALHGMHTLPPVRLCIKNAQELLVAAMRYFVGEKLVWLPEYNEVAEWLADTQGKGLTLQGSNGVGKTVMCKYALPAIFLKEARKVVSYYDYYDLNAHSDEILEKKIVAIDDIGNEEQATIYGNKRWVLPEVVDSAEKRNNLIILSTNLNAEELMKKYGVRTLDRIIAVTRRVKIQHKSFRE